jgi:hypothetical protein
MAEQRRGSIAGAFAWRLIEMLESPAHRALSLSARKILDRLEIEFHRHGGKPEDNGRLPCTFDHFVEFGIHRHAIRPGIREVALGFVEITRKGCAGTAGYRQSTLYHLTYRHPSPSRATASCARRRSRRRERSQALAKLALRRASSLRSKQREERRQRPILAPLRKIPTAAAVLANSNNQKEIKP